jgi:hypothetical protein
MIITESRNTIFASVSSTQKPIINRSSKNDLPPELLAEAQQKNISILAPTTANLPLLYKNYPDGSVLFPNNVDVATKFNTVIQEILKNPGVIEFFRKIHIQSLNSIYAYFMKIYTNLNLTNPGCSQETETPTANISTFLIDETTYATNKKKLIMNHFINLIQAQFGSSIISYVPTTPSDMAVSLGKVFIHNDCGIDLKNYSKPQTDPKIIADQSVYFNFLQKYIDFFQTYTNYLSQIDTNGTNQFYLMAQFISNLINPKDTKQTTLLMDPAMFFYDIESMRAIQFIPFVSSTIPASSKLIPWAPIITNAAIKNLTTNGHAIAYFKDATGKITPNQNEAQKLFLLIETGPVLFEQELLAQPEWLNSQNGNIRILRACLGDFSALVGTGILDIVTETVIQKSMNPDAKISPQASAKRKNSALAPAKVSK